MRGSARYLIIAILVAVAAIVLVPPLTHKATATSRRSRPAAQQETSEYNQKFLAASRLWRSHRQYFEAEDALLAILIERPSDSLAENELSQLYRAQGRAQDECAALERIVHPSGNWGSSLQSDAYVLARLLVLAGTLGERQVEQLTLSRIFESGDQRVGEHLPVVSSSGTGTIEEDIGRALTLAGTRLVKSMSRNAEATEVLEEALRRDPENGLAHFYLGYVYQKQRRKDDAIHALRSAIRCADDELVVRESERLLKAMGG